ncbi:hypothetical protein Htur_0505 [Haloterrigena turkmenica DSM 5511]|uniref:Uncharacterized protein n=1 Tax=Haloterrigena turkmenica (strain ATCC 51198 / DSM 5511 / JCM 9101 / NCIMB 13204 / VKM B-1734 / 4k) TaxID=543526 RepID=D2RVN9_HALTV|nr:hypothetical protein [Haloterrigena turkmenica]ADB59403.1 hypothetical protein Htur_0505 [Haloterrigena turkmenica DSM 5511]
MKKRSRTVFEPEPNRSAGCDRRRHEGIEAFLESREPEFTGE